MCCFVRAWMIFQLIITWLLLLILLLLIIITVFHLKLLVSINNSFLWCCNINLLLAWSYLILEFLFSIKRLFFLKFNIIVISCWNVLVVNVVSIFNFFEFFEFWGNSCFCFSKLNILDSLSCLFNVVCICILFYIFNFAVWL